jgi:hypothetical protein
VSIGKPQELDYGRTAYFRHRFTTTKRHSNLELRCRRDDGIIVYLDGEEVGRDNMESGPDAYLLAAKSKVEEDKAVVLRIALQRNLEPGPHVLAISVHNTAQRSMDLLLGGVTLVETLPSPKTK